MKPRYEWVIADDLGGMYERHTNPAHLKGWLEWHRAIVAARRCLDPQPRVFRLVRMEIG